jgi:hypothetical protein
MGSLIANTQSWLNEYEQVVVDFDAELIDKLLIRIHPTITMQELIEYAIQIQKTRRVVGSKVIV